MSRRDEVSVTFRFARGDVRADLIPYLDDVALAALDAEVGRPLLLALDEREGGTVVSTRQVGAWRTRAGNVVVWIGETDLSYGGL